MSSFVHLFVFDGYADWEPAFAICWINNPKFQLRPEHYKLRTVGLDTKPIKSAGGITVLPDIGINDLDPAQSALLILPGGDPWEAGANVVAVEKAQKFWAANVPVAAICAATGAIARSGMLDDKKHTSNAAEYLLATGYAGAKHYVARPAVTDKNVVTASGMASLEFAYEIAKLLQLYNPEVLEPWYQLFKTGDITSYAALMNATKAPV